MLHIYIEIRYYHQLSKISPEVLANLIIAINSTMKENGASIISNNQPLHFAFDTEIIGSCLGAARALMRVQYLFDACNKRIREYTVYCDCSSEPKEIVYEKMEQDCKKISSDTGIFCTYSSQKKLEEYIVFDYPELGNPIYLKVIKKYRFMNFDPEVIRDREKNSPIKKTEKKELSEIKKKENFYVFPVESDRIYCSLREFLDSISLDELVKFVPESQKKFFNKYPELLKNFDLRRFELQLPDVIVFGFEQLLNIVFDALNSQAEKQKISKKICVINKESLDEKSKDFLNNCSLNRENLAVVYEKEVQTFASEEEFVIPSEINELYQLCVHARKYLIPFEFENFFKFLCRDNVYSEALLKLFYNFGFIGVENDWRSFAKISNLEHISDEQAEKNDKLLGLFIMEKYRHLELTVSVELLYTLSTLSVVPDVDFIQIAILQSYRNGTLNLMQDKITQKLFCGKDINSAALSLNLYRLFTGFCSLCKGDLDAAENSFSTANSDVPGMFLGLAHCSFIKEDYAKAAEYVKSALIGFQYQKNRDGEGRTLYLISRISLAQERISDSFDYLEYALSCAEGIKNSYWKIAIKLDMVASCFIQGNYSKALRYTEKLERECEDFFSIEQQVLTKFIEGRCYFSIGDYKTAIETFENARNLANEYKLDKASELCLVWKSRVMLYDGRPGGAEKVFIELQTKNPDSFLFLVESSVMYRNKIPPEEFIEKNVQSYLSQTVWNDTKISWDSGFSFLEDRCFGRTRNRRCALRLLDAFVAYLKSQNEEYKQDSLMILHHFTRDSGFISYDSNNALYYYLYYLVMPEIVDAKSIDRETILGRAFKCMQEKVSRIDDANMQTRYMQESYWNSKLFKDAKAHKMM